MSLDQQVRDFERAVESGDTSEIAKNASAVLRYMTLAAREKGSTPAEVAAEIDLAGGGVAGLLDVQGALRRYMERPNVPVELRLNSVYQNFEASSCIALFDNEDAALAYFRSALLPRAERYTDPNGYFQSFRSDSLCHNCNPHGGNCGGEGEGILTPMQPWRNYDGTAYVESAPPRNPPPLTGHAPSPPTGSKLLQEAS